MTRRTFEVRAHREGGWWAIEVPEVRGAFSQARAVEEVEPMAREVVALLLQVPEDSFDLVLVDPTR